MPLPYSLPFPLIGPIGTLGNLAWMRQLLPRGLVWLIHANSRTGQTLLALGDEFDQVRSRVRDMLVEGDPRVATETLEDWERVVGLPDETVPTISMDPAVRRLAIVQKLVRQGGQTPAFFIALAAACGYTVTIKDDYWTTLARCGSRIGARTEGTAWAYAWQVTVSAPTGPALSHAQLEAVIRRAAPTHTIVMFVYL